MRLNLPDFAEADSCIQNVQIKEYVGNAVVQSWQQDKNTNLDSTIHSKSGWLLYKHVF
jgi:hypothetical protein